MKLYKVTCRGMQYSLTGIAHGINYVRANDPETAYRKVRELLDKYSLGFCADVMLKHRDRLLSLARKGLEAERAQIGQSK